MIVEALLEFVRKNIVGEIIQSKEIARQVTLITLIFIGVFTMNITGVIPGFKYCWFQRYWYSFNFCFDFICYFYLHWYTCKRFRKFMKAQLIPIWEFQNL